MTDIQIIEISILSPPEGVDMTPQMWIEHGCGYIIKADDTIEKLILSGEI